MTKPEAETARQPASAASATRARCGTSSMLERNRVKAASKAGRGMRCGRSANHDLPRFRSPACAKKASRMTPSLIAWQFVETRRQSYPSPPNTSVAGDRGLLALGKSARSGSPAGTVATNSMVREGTADATSPQSSKVSASSEASLRHRSKVEAATAAVPIQLSLFPRP